MKSITFEIEISDDGEAFVRLPEGPGQQQNAAKVAPLTIKIAEAIGPVEERHIGNHTHTHDNHTHDNHTHA